MWKTILGYNPMFGRREKLRANMRSTLLVWLTTGLETTLQKLASTMSSVKQELQLFWFIAGDFWGEGVRTQAVDSSNTYTSFLFLFIFFCMVWKVIFIFKPETDEMFADTISFMNLTNMAKMGTWDPFYLPANSIYRSPLSLSSDFGLCGRQAHYPVPCQLYWSRHCAHCQRSNLPAKHASWENAHTSEDLLGASEARKRTHAEL